MRVKPQWLKISDAGVYFGISPANIQKKIDKGELVFGVHIGVFVTAKGSSITLVNVEKLEELITTEALKQNNKLDNILKRLI